MQERLLRQFGFTLIELMATIGIAAVVMAMAIPSFSTAIKNNRLTAQTNYLVTDLNRARSEAIKRGVRVTLCKSTDGSTCVTTGDWSGGWIVFVNPNNNNAFDAGDTLLKTQGSAQSQISVVGNFNLANRVNYQSDGGITTTGTIKVCDDRLESVGKSIVLITTGRARINTGQPCP